MTKRDSERLVKNGLSVNKNEDLEKIRQAVDALEEARDTFHATQEAYFAAKEAYNDAQYEYRVITNALRLPNVPAVQLALEEDSTEAE